LAVADGIGRAMNGFRVIVNKSTVPVGTTEKVRKAVSAVSTHPFAVVSNPEFLKEGTAVEDFLKPDRVIIGVDDERARSVMSQLYAPFLRTGNPVLFMDCSSAVLTQYAATALLASRISFLNEIATLFHLMGAYVGLVRPGI